MSEETKQQENSCAKHRHQCFLMLSFGLIGLFVLFLAVMKQEDQSARSNLLYGYQNTAPELLESGVDRVHSCKKTVSHIGMGNLAKSIYVEKPLRDYESKCDAIEAGVADLRKATNDFLSSELSKTIEDLHLVSSDAAEAEVAKFKSAVQKTKVSSNDLEGSTRELAIGLMKYHVSQLPKSNLAEDRFSVRVENFQRAADSHSIYSAQHAYESLSQLYSSTYGVDLPKYKGLIYGW